MRSSTILVAFAIVAILALPTVGSHTKEIGESRLDPLLTLGIARMKLDGRDLETVPILVIVREDTLRGSLGTLWRYGEIMGIYGPVLSMRATPLAIERLARLNIVERIEMSSLDRLFLDESVPAIGAPSVWNTVLDISGKRVDGSGQIVGIVDTGIDYTHPDFWFLNGTTKILYIWHQGGSGMPPPGFNYGIECARSQIQDKSCPVVDEDGHGTHVAGIAASSGMAEGKRPGVAPGASYIIVKSGRYVTRCGDQGWSFPRSQWLDGVAYIVQRAKQLGKQPIVNLSLGSKLGAHDGTSAAERALDAFVSQGAVIAVSAGNSGRGTIHASGNLTQAGTVTLKLRVPSGEEAVRVDLWYSSSDSFDISVNSPSGKEVVNGPTPDTGKPTLEGNVMILSGSSGSGKEWFVQINSPPGQSVKAWTVTLKASQTSGRGPWDAWIDGDCTTPEFDDGLSYVADNLKTIGIPGTARDVITVGAFVTKTSWVGRDGNVYQSREADQSLASFSSRGPTLDGRMKPDVTAPGAAIASARSSLIKPKGSDAGPFHWNLQGTSMSAPHVAGLAALMLQKDASLTPQRIKELLRATAKLDTRTGNFERLKGSFDWGAGKIDAFGAVKQKLVLKVQASGLPEGFKAELSMNGNPAGQIDALGRILEVDPFSLPTITAAQTIAAGPGTRFFAKESTWVPTDSSSHEFKYTTQYELVLNSAYGSPMGAGWHDAGSSAKISVPQSAAARGLLGLLGVKFVFIEWSGSTTLTTPEATIKVTGPINLTANWSADYTPLLVFIIFLAALVGGLSTYKVILPRLPKAVQPLPPKTAKKWERS